MRLLAVLGMSLICSVGTAAAGQSALQVPGAGNRIAGELCKPSLSVPADVAKTPRARRLGELPPGDLSLAVLRKVDGCLEPTIVRYGIGSDSPGARSRPARRK